MRPNRKIIAILVGLSMLVSLLIFASPASAAWYVCQAGRVSEGGVRVRGNYGQLTSVYFINKGSLPASVFVKDVKWNKTWWRPAGGGKAGERGLGHGC
jgi:hypothetical protein